jgi:ubiquinone/menaquinone biosynthesis C-methylase UbiE
MTMMQKLKPLGRQHHRLKGGYLLDLATELERLTIQARAWEHAAEALIGHIGVEAGWKCVDLGCGPRGVLGPLSGAVAPMGTVIGIDNDPMLLAAARAWAEQQGMHNVWLLQDDAYEADLPAEAFDLVHTRFLFAPCGRDEALLAAMLDLARPGGIVALQEPDSSSWNCHPRRAGWDALKPAILRAFRAVGGDFDAGQRLYSMLRRAGLEDVRVAAHVLTLPPGDPYRQSPVQFAASLRGRILEGGLLSGHHLDAAVADCAAAAEDQSTLFTSFTLVQAWGRKPE